MVAFRSASTVNASNVVGGADVPYPSGLQAGDLLLLVAHCAPDTPLDLSPGGSWTLLHTAQTNAGSVEQGQAAVWWMIATGSESGTVNVSSGGLGIAELRATMVAYSGVDTTDPLDGYAFYPGSGFGQTFIDAPALTTTDASFLVRYFSVTASSTLTTPTNVTQRVYETSGVGMLWGDEQGVAGSNPLRRSTTSDGGNSRVGYTIAIRSSNQPPNAPVLVSPGDGTTIERDQTQRFDWDFSDPNTGDSQSAYNLRYRKVGTSTWTETGWVSSTSTFHDFAAGTFADLTDYEWQVATKDSQGAEGPFSASWFFTAATRPGAPTWVDPINGQTITTDSYTGVISAPDVDESEWRLVADNAGVIDESTILQGPVLKTTGQLREHTFSGLTDDTPIWWQARVKFAGLWSEWASIRTPVDFTPPPAPSFTLTPAADPPTILVDITNPAPSGSEPPVTHNEVYVTDPGKSEERRADAVAPNGSWLYRTPVGDRTGSVDYSGRIRVVAHGDNGTTASS